MKKSSDIDLALVDLVSTNSAVLVTHFRVECLTAILQAAPANSDCERIGKEALKIMLVVVAASRR
jgi:hypothetical protein